MHIRTEFYLDNLSKLFATALLMASILPSLSLAQNTLSAANIAAASRSSSLHIRTTPVADIRNLALRQIYLGNGITMRFDQYLRASSLDRTARISELNRGNFARYLKNRAQLSETVSQLQDRVVVERVVSFSLKSGACTGKGKLPAALRTVCFRPKPRKGKISKKLMQDIEKIRTKLANSRKRNAFPGVSMARARKMNDAQLLDAMINNGPKEIRHVSVIPLKAFADRRVGIIPALGAGRLNFNRQVRVPNSRDFRLLPNIRSGLTLQPIQPVDPRPKFVGREAEATIFFEQRHFLTGFTFGHEISDVYEITLAGKTWLTDRYYVRLAYEFSAGFGLRIPFSLSVTARSALKQLVASTGSARRNLRHKPGRNVTITGNVVNVGSDGRPSYRAVGLGSSQYFNGNELVFGFSANCGFYASIPGPDISYTCPTIGKSYHKNFNPVIGSRNTSDLSNFWIDGDDIGFGYGLSRTSGAWVDVGVKATISKGRIGFKINPINRSKFKQLRSTNNWLTSSNQELRFTVVHKNFKNSKGRDVIGFEINNPKYKFNVAVTPQVRLRLNLDLGIYQLRKTIGPFALDALSIGSDFTLTHHDGTVRSHRFPM